LSEADINISGMMLTKKTLINPKDSTYTLPIITPTADGNITVSISKTGYSFTQFNTSISVFAAAERTLSISAPSGASTLIPVGSSLQLTAVKNPANMNVIWSIDSGNQYATIDNTGKVTATSNTTGSTVSVTVRVISDDGINPQLSTTFNVSIAPENSE